MQNYPQRGINSIATAREWIEAEWAERDPDGSWWVAREDGHVPATERQCMFLERAYEERGWHE